MTKRIGILLAAGRGRRMGQLKQLLPWPPPDGDRCLVAAAFDAISPACDEMLVVVGQDQELIVRALGNREHTLVYADSDKPMFESVRAGLKAAQELDDEADLVVHPADHPQVTTATLELLCRRSRETPPRAVMPQYEGRGGHPVFVPAAIGAEVLGWSGEGGLRQYWREHSAQYQRIDVSDSGVVFDLDTPEDYRR